MFLAPRRVSTAFADPKTSRTSLLTIARHAAQYNTPQLTTQPRRPVPERAPSFRTTARIVGVLYLAGMVVGIGGNILIQSILTAPDVLPTIAASSGLLAVGAVCWLATVAGDNLTVSRDGDSLVIVDGSGGRARVTRADQLNSNGVVHSVDRVLMPATE